jgi:hypothetical protein
MNLYRFHHAYMRFTLIVITRMCILRVQDVSTLDTPAPDTSALGRFGAGGKLFVIKPQCQKNYEHLQFIPYC